MLSGIERSLALGYKLRRDKFSPLIKGRCLMHITLTSSESSSIPINDGWSVLLKRIRRMYPSFQYFKMTTEEGVSGVLHILARNDVFITKQWFSDNWNDIYSAFVTWSTQLYGSPKRVLGYLMGYLGHHERFTYGFSQKWIFKGSVSTMRAIFREYGSRYGYSTACSIWRNIVMNFDELHSIQFSLASGPIWRNVVNGFDALPSIPVSFASGNSALGAVHERP